MKTLPAMLLASSLALSIRATEFHVALTGSDANRGTESAPLRTIQHAAELAQPGDIITVHAGVYRERIHPPRGGTSDSRRIVYRAAPGEHVEIKGSEIVKNWSKVQNDLWKVILPNSFFGAFNPFNDLIHGDWFDPRGRPHHTGAVYLDGDWLTEAARFEDVLQPAGSSPLWFARVDADNTTIWAQFKGVSPNEHLVEINARRTVFYPDETGCDYITVRGFTLSQAATPWAPPTAEQVALLGTHWSKGWIIESNTVSYSTCCGISLGKYGDQYDNTSANTAEGYVKTIERALKNGWDSQHIGHHLVQGNTISHCEQAGIVGSLGAAFSTITGNTIHEIHVRRLFSGAEMAGIKFHAAIDTVIRGNHIYRTCRGLWLDWMAQGTRVAGNLFHDNASEDLFVEVDHGPFVVDNNLFLSGASLLDMSEGGAYIYNLFAGKITASPEPRRQTPYHPAHSTAVAGLVDIKGGDDRFLNNIFVGDGKPPASVKRANPHEARWIAGFGLAVYDDSEYPLQTGGNLFCHGAQPYRDGAGDVVAPELNPKPTVSEQNGHWFLHLELAAEWKRPETKPVTAALLGKTRVAGLAYENADGTELNIVNDYLGRPRSATHPTPGPFETANPTQQVW